MTASGTEATFRDARAMSAVAGNSDIQIIAFLNISQPQRVATG